MTTVTAPPATATTRAARPVRSRSQLQLAGRRFRRNPSAMGGLATLAVVLVAAFAGPLVLPYGPAELSDSVSAGPGTDGHLFGTDSIGRDMLQLTLRGIQWSMLIAGVFVVVAGTIGVLVGAVSGYFGGRVDNVIMRAVEVTMTIPLLALVIVLAAAAPSARTPLGVALIIAIGNWMVLARIVRVQFLSLREREYVEAAHALGASGARIVLRHLLPNSLGQVIVWATLGTTTAVGEEAALSFLGFGVQGSQSSLGRLVAEGAAAAESRPWLFYFPGLALLVIVLSISLIGDGIQDAFDPASPH